MVIFYNLKTKEIIRTEDNTMIPSLPVGTLEEQKKTYKDEGVGFVSLPYEMGVHIFDYDLRFDGDVFTGIQPKGVV